MRSPHYLVFKQPKTVLPDQTLIIPFALDHKAKGSREHRESIIGPYLVPQETENLY